MARKLDGDQGAKGKSDEMQANTPVRRQLGLDTIRKVGQIVTVHRNFVPVAVSDEQDRGRRHRRANPERKARHKRPSTGRSVKHNNSSCRIVLADNRNNKTTRRLGRELLAGNRNGHPGNGAADKDIAQRQAMAYPPKTLDEANRDQRVATKLEEISRQNVNRRNLVGSESKRVGPRSKNILLDARARGRQDTVRS